MLQILSPGSLLRMEPFIVDAAFLDASHLRVAVQSSLGPNQAPERGLAKGLLGVVKKKMEGKKKAGDDDEDDSMRGGASPCSAVASRFPALSPLA